MSETRPPIIRFFCSLQLTVILLTLSMVLVFVATLAQVNLGIYAVQEKYFRSFVVFSEIPGSETSLPIFPGGYLIGGFLLANLIGVLFFRFRYTWAKAGILLTHIGLILLLVGELLSGMFQEDFSMELRLREPTNYSESFLRHELVVIDTTDPKTDSITAIPETLLKPGTPIQHASLPFVLKVREFFPNAGLEMREPTSTAPASLATQGVGPRVVATPMRVTYKSDERNMPTAFVELTGTQGSLGTWLLSPMLALDQTFTHEGRTYSLALRVERRYKPFTLTLTDLRHDVYAGSDIPRNFSSRVRLQTQDGKEDREVLIFMNNPLRHGGYTFYQYQMNKASNHSVLQVVRNPSWQMPYIACSVMTLGMAVQFLLTLAGFIRKRRAAPATSPKAA